MHTLLIGTCFFPGSTLEAHKLSVIGKTSPITLTAMSTTEGITGMGRDSKKERWVLLVRSSSVLVQSAMMDDLWQCLNNTKPTAGSDFRNCSFPEHHQQSAPPWSFGQ